MKHNESIIILLISVCILCLECIQLVNTYRSNRIQEDSFLPMVYESQLFQSISTDGLDIISPTFHAALLSKKITQPVLVLRYSGLSCKSCLQDCFNSLNRLIPDYENNGRLMIVVSEAEASSLRTSSSILLGHGETLGYSLEDTHIPHFFVYDPVKQIILHTFTPDQSDPNALTIYISNIVGRYGI